MKVLWFEVTEPSAYKGDNTIIGGWQDSLELIVRKCDAIELYVAFESLDSDKVILKNNVTYIPIKEHYGALERIRNLYTWKDKARKIAQKSIEIVERIKPEIVHIFGNEWPFGLIAKHVSQPVIIHIQGSIVPYYNARYAPGYNLVTELLYSGLNIPRMLGFIFEQNSWKSRLKMEKEIWNGVHYYMGRTNWDRALVNVLCTEAKYFHVEEALRPDFIESTKTWKYIETSKIKIVSTGCSSFLKGVDVMLKTAHVLKKKGVDFEWVVAGNMPYRLRKVIEGKEGMRFSDNNLTILGYVSSDYVKELLCNCTLYVHTAYIENSPNSICEAQLLGVPIISTNVGGITSLIKDGVEGDLLPTNDPWLFADAIIRLSNDKERMNTYSKNGRTHALKRHDNHNILSQLLFCYNTVIENKINDICSR